MGRKPSLPGQGDREGHSEDTSAPWAPSSQDGQGLPSLEEMKKLEGGSGWE